MNPGTLTPDPNVADLLHGTAEIANHLGLRRRQVEGMIARRTIPTFRLGKTVCARRSTLNAFIAEREADAIADARKPSPESLEPTS